MRSGTGWIALVAPDRLVPRRVAAGEAVFRQGDPTVAVYRVEQGRVRLVRHLEDGASVALHVARAGGGFAEAALFSDVYHCDAVVEVDAVLTLVPKADLLAALEADPRASLAFARMLAAQVRDLRARLELRNIRSAPERILAWLKLQASGSPATVRLDRPWTEIAAEIGLTHEAIYRALAALERDGRIERAAGEVRVTAPSPPLPNP
ncbi:MAG TPA: Crp/Fnr family transcriptional regulator [Azospirillum sp.]|nr:Crp/Fnr family transcriptional regulator [Azospirillum sp.]